MLAGLVRLHARKHTPGLCIHTQTRAPHAHALPLARARSLSLSHTHTCVILITFPQHQWFPERTLILRYTYIAWFVIRCFHSKYIYVTFFTNDIIFVYKVVCLALVSNAVTERQDELPDAYRYVM